MRKYLGLTMHPIYLCGVFDYPEKVRKQFEKKNIYVVDLGPIVPAASWPDIGQRHQEGNRLFLEYLHAGNPLAFRTWPGQTLIDETPQLDPPFNSYSNTDPSTSAVKIADAWRRIRYQYPGWLVCPAGTRKVLNQITERDDRHIQPALPHLLPPDDIRVIYELLWRAEVAQIPFYEPWLVNIGTVVNAYNPFPAEVSHAMYSILHNQGVAIPQVLLHWQAVVEHDNLPVMHTELTYNWSLAITIWSDE